MEIEKPPVNPGEKVLEVKDVTFIDDEYKMMLKGVSFNVRRGEILGIARGVEGNGPRELIDCIHWLR